MNPPTRIERGRPRILRVASDESGSDGEQLFSPTTTVFAHASVSLTQDEASEIIDRLRTSLGTAAPELKSKQLLARKALPLAESLLREPWL